MGTTLALTAQGKDSSGATVTLGADVAWTSSAPTVAYVSDLGVVTGATPGTATISATPAGDGGVTGSAQITVPTPTFLSLQASPASLTLAAAGTQAISVTGLVAGDAGVTLPLTTGLTWSTSSASVATVDDTGLVTAVALGTATITATLTATSQAVAIPVTVTGSVLASLAVTPVSFVVAAAATQQLTATGTFTDGSTQDLTTAVVWTSSAPATASVSAGGLVTGVAAGMATLTAAVSGQSATAAATVTTGVTNDPDVFVNGFAAGVQFAAFGGSNTVLAIDTTTTHNGNSSLALTLPATGYAGGAFVSTPARNLSSYNALTFWAMGSSAFNFTKAGVGNDNTASTPLAAEWDNIPITTSWTEIIIPVPLPSDFAAEDGLFYFASSGVAGTLWLADIQYQSLDAGVIGTPAPSMTSGVFAEQVGDVLAVTNAKAVFPVNGVNEDIVAQSAGSWGYFDFVSSNPVVASVDSLGNITCLDAGTSVISATLGSVPVSGTLTVNVTSANGPTVAAPTPTLPAADVISVLSSAYTNIPVTDYGATWSNTNKGANLTQTPVAGVATNEYLNMAYIGIEFLGTKAVNLSTMTALHVDMWTPDGTTFGLKIADFGGATGSGTAEVTQGEVDFTATSTPAITTGTWISFDVPLTAFESAGLTSAPQDVQQLLLTNGDGTYYVENIYFHQ